MSPFPTMQPQLDARTVADEIRRLLDEVDQTAPQMPGPAGESSPNLDVIETDASIEVVVDLPGVSTASLRVALIEGVLVIAGDKLEARVSDRDGAVFHLVERGFGRFARAIHLGAAIDGSRADAALRDGELRVVIPKIPERRGRELRIPVEDAT
jgi:HSP20 family protein